MNFDIIKTESEKTVMAEKKILVVGSANMDFTLNMYKVPASGETLIDDGGFAYLPGGKGGNAATAFCRLGCHTVLCAKVGADLHGQKLYNYYKGLGIDTSYLKADQDNPTGLAVVMKESDGNNRIIVYPGANSHLISENVLEAFDSNPDAVYINFEIPFHIALAAAKVAAGKGIPIFIDAAPASRDFQLENLPFVEIFSPNEEETLEYTGIMPKGADASLRAALALYRRVKCRYVVIKQGERGSFVYDGKHYYIIPAKRVGNTVDTTAAGDAFTAALTDEYLRTGDILHSVRFATAAGAITVTRHGASGAIPTRAEIEAVEE